MEKAYLYKQSRAFFGLITAIACVGALSSCGTVQDDGGGKTDGGSTNPGLNVADAPLYVEVLTNPEGNAAKTTAQGECYFTSADTAGAGATKTCTIRIPELVLHFSDLQFRVGTSSETVCASVDFVPYSFRRSNILTYSPIGDHSDDTDCTGAKPADLKCWGGAAPFIMGASFPNYTFKYFLPSNMLSTTFTMPSTNSIRASNYDVSFGTNADVANNLATGARVTSLDHTGGDDVSYIGSSMVDYTVRCRDPYANNLYSMKIIIADYNTVVSPVDDGVDYYWDWND